MNKTSLGVLLMKNKFISKLLIVSFLVMIVIGFASCNVKNHRDGTTPFSTKPTTIEFWNCGTKIAEYENACVNVASVCGDGLIRETWYYYEIEVDDVIVDTIIYSEALVIKYKGRRFR